jgi:ribosomal protein S18 acetylase RimI-like enzyme
MGKPLAAASVVQTGRPRERPRMGLTPFDWAPLVRRGFFQGLITAYVGAGLGLILFETQGMRATSLVLVDVWLSVFCAVIAFVRVWKSIREEGETADQWDDVIQSKFDRVLDRIFEIPYLFTITVLPFAAIAPQAFIAMLAVFYFVDNHYNADLARGAAGLMRGDSSGRAARQLSPWQTAVAYARAIAAAAGRSFLLIRRTALRHGRDTVMVDFFVRRSRINSALMAVLGVAFLLSLFFMAAAQRSLATDVCFAALALALVTELFIEPLRNLPDDVWLESRGVVAIERVDDPDKLTPSEIRRLADIHQEAFGPAERQYEMEDMLRRVAAGGGVLRVITQDQIPIGYQYLEQAADSRFVFLWYFAVDSVRRNGGIGAKAFRNLVELVRSEYPAARYLMFEVHRSGMHGGLDGDDVYSRLIYFYRRLGSYLVRGIDYRLPAANDETGAASVDYRPMFVPLTGEPDLVEVREGVLAMASDEYGPDHDDPRWLAMTRTAEIDVIPPPEILSGTPAADSDAD